MGSVPFSREQVYYGVYGGPLPSSVRDKAIISSGLLKKGSSDVDAYAVDTDITGDGFLIPHRGHDMDIAGPDHPKNGPYRASKGAIYNVVVAVANTGSDDTDADEVADEDRSEDALHSAVLLEIALLGLISSRSKVGRPDLVLHILRTDLFITLLPALASSIPDESCPSDIMIPKSWVPNPYLGNICCLSLGPQNGGKAMTTKSHPDIHIHNLTDAFASVSMGFATPNSVPFRSEVGDSALHGRPGLLIISRGLSSPVPTACIVPIFDIPIQWVSDLDILSLPKPTPTKSPDVLATPKTTTGESGLISHGSAGEWSVPSGGYWEMGKVFGNGNNANAKATIDAAVNTYSSGYASRVRRNMESSSQHRHSECLCSPEYGIWLLTALEIINGFGKRFPHLHVLVDFESAACSDRARSDPVVQFFDISNSSPVVLCEVKSMCALRAVSATTGDDIIAAADLPCLVSGIMTSYGGRDLRAVNTEDAILDAANPVDNVDVNVAGSRSDHRDMDRGSKVGNTSDAVIEAADDGSDVAVNSLNSDLVGSECTGDQCCQKGKCR